MDRWTWEGGWFFPNPPFERKVLEETADTCSTSTTKAS